MFPLIFLGSMAFWISTIIKSGNATAVVMAILGIILMILGDELTSSYWNVMLNPFNIPRDLNPEIWFKILVKNRLFLAAGSIVFILAGILKLQKRERFI